MKTRTKVIIASVSIVIGLAIAVYAVASADEAPKTTTHSTSESKPLETAETTPQEAAESTPVVETHQQSSVTPSAPQTPQKQAPASNDGGHIPFTQAPVVAGQPETYVGTVGQCPFYEMAGDKGCVPPSDIECNADWSVCTKKGEQ